MMMKEFQFFIVATVVIFILVDCTSCTNTWQCQVTSYHLDCIKGTDTIISSGMVNEAHFEEIVNFYKNQGYTVIEYRSNELRNHLDCATAKALEKQGFLCTK